jgi:CBS domain-containing protein
LVVRAVFTKTGYSADSKPFATGSEGIMDHPLKLMHLHGIRRLPVVENDTPITVISIRDLLAEAVEHHAKIINELEREHMTMLTSTA